MEFKKQVVSFDLAKKLKELGVEQDSLFWWREHLSGCKIDLIKAVNPPDDDYCDYYSAFTVAELGEILPKTIFNKNKTHYQGDYFQKYLGGDKQWLVGYECDCPELQSREERIVPNYCDFKETDARAQMLIYLLEKNLGVVVKQVVHSRRAWRVVVYGLGRHVASCGCSRRSMEPGSLASRRRTRRLVCMPTL